MSEPLFSNLVQKIKGMGNFDHPDFDAVDSMGESSGFDPKSSREALFVARDIATLEEAEYLDGGDGSEAKRTNPKQVLQATFARGKQ